MMAFVDPDWQARAHLRDVLIHHHAENSFLQRAAAAKGYEMTLEQAAKYARPFPGTTMSTTTTNILGDGPTQGARIPDRGIGGDSAGAAPTTRRSSPLPTLALMGLAALGGAGGGLLLSRVGQQTIDPAAADIRVYWGDQEITPERPGEAVTE